MIQLYVICYSSSILHYINCIFHFTLHIFFAGRWVRLYTNHRGSCCLQSYEHAPRFPSPWAFSSHGPKYFFGQDGVWIPTSSNTESSAIMLAISACKPRFHFFSAARNLWILPLGFCCREPHDSYSHPPHILNIKYQIRSNSNNWKSDHSNSRTSKRKNLKLKQVCTNSKVPIPNIIC